MANIGKRKSYRFPLLREFGAQVSVFLMDAADNIVDRLTAEIVNVSTGGVGGETSVNLKVKTRCWVVFRFPGPLEGTKVQGHVRWVREKGAGFAFGVIFSSLPTAAAAVISRISLDYRNCEGKLQYSMKDVCHRDCAYWSFCRKPVKLPILRKS